MMATDAVLRFMSSLEEGQIRQGVVTSVERFGAFVDLGGAPGLVRVPELSWSHFEAVSDVVEVGQQVLVEVRYLDFEQGQIWLSLKALHDDPLLEFARTRFGDVVAGRVTKVVIIGAFVELAGGIGGLIPASDIPGGRVLVEGQEVDVRVCDINLRERRVRFALA